MGEFIDRLSQNHEVIAISTRGHGKSEVGSVAPTYTQKAIAEAFRRMTEEHLCWTGVYNRFVDPLGKLFMMKAMFDGMPTEQAEAIFAVLQENAKKEMYGHGIGRHTQSDIYSFGKGDLDAISSYLGTKRYFFGEELTSVDVAIVPVVASLILTPIDTEIALCL